MAVQNQAKKQRTLEFVSEAAVQYQNNSLLVQENEIKKNKHFDSLLREFLIKRDRQD